MSAATPLVSICIPVYNAGIFIEETISCCVNQTYSNLEIIFSDNCSNDGTYERILAHKDPRIKVYRNETNIGLVPNYIKSLDYATGKYMGFLGADDAMDLTAVEKSVKVMEDPSNHDVVLVNSYVQVIDEKSKVVFKKRFIFGGGRLSGYWGIRSNFIYGSNTIGEPNGSFFRRETYERIPQPRFKNANTWTMDLDMKFELLLLGDGYMIPEHLGRFRVSRQSTSLDQLRFSQARLFRQYAMNLYRDKRYHLSFIWVIIATVMSTFMQFARNVFYMLHARDKK
jgi:glycosyltransferase involved in cell wall biosynthesis